MPDRPDRPDRPGRSDRSSAAAERRRQLPEEIADYVREAILSGQFRPGEFIRLEAIADRLGTSVTPVREALMQLRGEDIVRLLPRRGYVAAPLSRVDIEDLFDVQVYLASELARRAMLEFDARGLDELAEINRQLGLAVRARSAVDVERQEDEFHRLINETAGSGKLGYLLRSASNYLPRHLSADGQWRAAVTDDHQRIVDALRARDADAVTSAIADHLLLGKLRLLRHLDELGFWRESADSTAAS